MVQILIYTIAARRLITSKLKFLIYEGLRRFSRFYGKLFVRIECLSLFGSHIEIKIIFRNICSNSYFKILRVYFIINFLWNRLEQIITYRCCAVNSFKKQPGINLEESLLTDRWTWRIPKWWTLTYSYTGKECMPCRWQICFDFRLTLVVIFM